MTEQDGAQMATGIDLGDLVSGSATLSIAAKNGKSLNLTYNPQKVSIKALSGDDNESMSRALVEFELTWDLVMNGAPVPNTYDSYLVTPLQVISLVFNAVLKAQRVDPK